MNNEEKILAMLSEMRSDIADVKATQAEQGKQLAEQGKQLAEQGKQLAEQGKQLAEQGKQLTEQGKQLAEQGKQLAEQGDRLLRVEFIMENTIIPDIKGVANGHLLLQETLARKEDVEALHDAITEWEVADKAIYAEIWNRISKLEQAQ